MHALAAELENRLDLVVAKLQGKEEGKGEGEDRGDGDGDHDNVENAADLEDVIEEAADDLGRYNDLKRIVVFEVPTAQNHAGAGVVRQGNDGTDGKSAGSPWKWKLSMLSGVISLKS